MLVSKGAPVELDAHIARASASVLDLYDAIVPDELGELVRERARALTLGRVRFTLAPHAGGPLKVEIVASEVDAAAVFPTWERGAALRSFVVSSGLGMHKWADRAELDMLERGLGTGRIALLVDATGEVLEASRANVCAIDGDLVITPPADGRILEGVARARAIAAARSLGIEVREEALTLERLITAGEAFLTGSVRGMEPVRTVDDAALRPPGELLGELAAQVKQLWLGETPAGARAS